MFFIENPMVFVKHALVFQNETDFIKFDDSMEYNVAADGSLKFPDAEITIDQDLVRLFPTENLKRFLA